LKAKLSTIIKLVVLLGLGVFIIWYTYSKLTPKDKEDLFTAFREANYLWIGLSILIAVFSHYLRARRWNYLLEPLGHSPKVSTNFYALMTGYLVNMAIPRGGEAARAGLVTRYAGVPFSQSFGTIAAERVVDLFMLLAICAATFFMQFDVLGPYYDQITTALSEKFTLFNLLLLAGLAIGGIVLLIIIIKKTAFGKKVKEFLKGLIDGLKSIFTTKKKWHFIGQTLLIWGSYLVMFYVCFFAIEATADVPVGAVFAGFVLGSFSIIIIPGGIGAYPAAIALAIGFYMDNVEAQALALGWIIWGSQFVINLVGGGISFLLISRQDEVENRTLEDKVV